MNIPFQLVMAITPAHRNQYLFSDHYLDNLLPQDPRWRSALPQAQAFLTWLQELYAHEQRQLPSYNEPQLENHWFRPILAQLGHAFEGQASVPGLNAGVKRPDYVFFPDDITRQAAVRAQNTAEYTADALAVGEVKRWDVPLGKKEKGGGASFEAQNPSWQIDYYVRATGLDWGLLSNGRLWRLVHKDTSQRLSIYYEVDLVDLLSRGDAELMQYFTLFFHQGAFQPDTQGRVFLADALAESRAYAVALEEDVEANVYQALERLMQGFLDLPSNNLGADDLRQIYENSLYLLYRLLFILYGESRGLLPLDMDSYRDNYSLDRTKREVARLRTQPAQMTTIYWSRLKNLFQIINGDNVALNRSLGVPRYNGGLFDPIQHPFLEKYAVGDLALVEAIDLLSRRTTEAGREFVDYRTLGVRHLGSIYEGLLEYQPRYATEPTVAVRDNKGEHWVEAAQAPTGARIIDRREAGQVYLETDRGERKATGSYYTPQYIVEYIVENTLGPLTKEAVERVKERAREAKGKAARAAAEQSLVDEILNLKVLDPAMGSGHFLVEATEYLARALATDPYVETEAPVEEDLTYWKRRVVERCIYGVDKNPLAVELAKLSLWLATVAADKPLSFLDHHLKCGDSLIGARVADLGWAPPVVLNKQAQKQLEQQKAGQVNMFEYVLSQQLPVVMGRILEITEVESDSYETVQAKEAADQAVQELKAPFQAVADLWVSAYFGNDFTQGEYDEALGLIGRRDELLALPTVQRAQEMAQERHFFHWELAFPEVFYDQHGQPLGERAGFDAVVGNPPYYSLTLGHGQEEADRNALAFFDIAYGYSTEYKINLFALFTEKGLALLCRGGRFSFILPNTVLSIHSLASLRRHVLSGYHLVRVVDARYRVFEEAEIGGNAVLVIERADKPKRRTLTCVRYSAKDWEDHTALVEVDQERFKKVPSARFVTNLALLDLLDNVELRSVPLGDVAVLYQGIITGNNRKYISNAPIDDRYRPVLRGADIERYSIKFSDNYVLFEPSFLWSNTDQSMFDVPEKIVSRQTSDHLVGAYDDQRFFTLDSTHVIHPLVDNRFFLALYNSCLLNFLYQQIVPELGRAFAQVKIVNLEKLPIRHIEFTTPADERQRLVEEASARAEKTVTRVIASGSIGSDSPLDRTVLSKAASPALDFVGERLAVNPEQSDVVHDLLAHLAEQMIAMNKEKQTVVEAFWLDLEGVADADTFKVLRHKGKWESTLWKSKACRPFVDQESRSTRSLDESLGWSEEAFVAFVKALMGKLPNLSDLVSVYRAHSSAYRELVARIEATDWLIDQIVYKLYGLTEEEIAIVEGRGG